MKPGDPEGAPRWSEGLQGGGCEENCPSENQSATVPTAQQAGADQRLRAIRKKRSKRRGCAKGGDFPRRTNAFFTEQRLLSLVAAHASVSQSLRR